MNLQNKKVLITGGTGGIGFSLIKKFTELGSNVLATGTNVEKLKKLKDNFKDIKTKQFNLDEHSNVEKFIESSSVDLGGLDILINNAGITCSHCRPVSVYANLLPTVSPPASVQFANI